MLLSQHEISNLGLMNCPYCEKDIADSVVRAYVSSQNGKAGRGKMKARTSEQMRAAARVRWEKRRKSASGITV
jgi:hypothetical protein